MDHIVQRLSQWLYFLAV